MKIKKEKYPKLIFGIYFALILISLFYPKYDGMEKMQVITNAIYFSSIFLGGSFVYLIKDKLKFSNKLVIFSLIYCFISMTFLPKYWAIQISAIPMTYIILVIAVTLKSPKWIQKNDISYGIYIYAWPIQTVVSCFYITYSIPKNVYVYMIICIILTYGFATLSWFLIEKPILNKVR